MDTLDVNARSELMARIRGKNTHPEMVVRRYLYSRGLRYRLHVRQLPGKPDIVLPGRRAVVFVHGCFWHGHSGCNTWKIPKTRTDYWQEKITGNKRRDARAIRQLRKSKWQVFVVWECELTEAKLYRLYKAICSVPKPPPRPRRIASVR